MAVEVRGGDGMEGKGGEENEDEDNVEGGEREGPKWLVRTGDCMEGKDNE